MSDNDDNVDDHVPQRKQHKKDDDFGHVPDEISKEIYNFAEKKFIPAVLQYMKENIYDLRDTPTHYAFLDEILAHQYLLIGTFSNETQYDLYILQQMMSLKTVHYRKSLSRKFIGSAIRICKDICRPDLADKFNEIVKGSFTPDKHQDKEDPSRIKFVVEAFCGAEMSDNYDSNCVPQEKRHNVDDNVPQGKQHKKDDDFGHVPDEISKEIYNFAEKKFIPAVLQYMESVKPELKGISRVSIHRLPFDVMVALPHFLDGVFSPEQKYDLCNLQEIMSIKRSPCYIKEAKRFIGSAIRICKDICRPDLADKFNEIVKGSFTPDEHQDKEDPSRGFFVAEGS